MKFLVIFLVAVASANAAVPNRNGRIVNGDVATPHQFPYQVFIVTTFAGRTDICGGSVISNSAVLTAAHCASDSTRQSFELIFGAQFWEQDEPNQQRRIVPASGWVQHPNHDGFLSNDIAVIRFADQPITLNEFVQAVELASDQSETFAGEVAQVSGFGRDSDASNSASEVLRFTRKTVITNAVCQSSFGSVVVASTICAAGTPSVNNSVCSGDSGGPLTVQRNGRSLQIGVVSFGSNQCATSTPDGYARVTHFRDWIIAQMP